APLTIGLPNGAVIQVDLPLAGRHNALNALAAAAAASALDIKPALIHQGLERVRPVPGRLHAMTGRHGLRLIDDSYNANPTSTAAAIEVLAAMPAPRVLVLGDMLELGEASATLHRETGRRAAAAGIERLYACGDMTRHAVEGFGTGGRHFDDQAALIEALKADLDGRESVLVKGSRGMRMERVVQALAVDAAAEVQAHAG
ncbi:MAG: cyanophycin synthetase, partial [Chromatiales bacterium]|nr:cyanophycin synthetase [Chromatiales bacterium]